MQFAPISFRDILNDEYFPNDVPWLPCGKGVCGVQFARVN